MSNATQETVNAILKCLQERSNIIILGHMHPDGDSVGSQLALGNLLESIGKQVQMITPDPVPVELQFLPGVEKIHTECKECPADYALILVDTPTSERSGYAEIEQLINHAAVTINIDHHISNSRYSDYNWVEPTLCSVGEMLFNLFKLGGYSITRETAMCLYASLITDTGGFRHANTTGSAFRMAAELVELGADPALMAREIYGTLPLRRYRLLAQALPSLTLYHNNQIAVISVTDEMFQAAEATLADCDGLVNYTATIQGVAIGILLRQVSEKNSIKASLRSRIAQYDVNSIARHYGGGGHATAAGCSVEGELNDVRDMILQESIKMIEQAHEGPP